MIGVEPNHAIEPIETGCAEIQVFRVMGSVGQLRAELVVFFGIAEITGPLLKKSRPARIPGVNRIVDRWLATLDQLQVAAFKVPVV